MAGPPPPPKKRGWTSQHSVLHWPALTAKQERPLRQPSRPFDGSRTATKNSSQQVPHKRRKSRQGRRQASALFACRLLFFLRPNDCFFSSRSVNARNLTAPIHSRSHAREKTTGRRTVQFRRSASSPQLPSFGRPVGRHWRRASADLSGGAPRSAKRGRERPPYSKPKPFGWGRQFSRAMGGYGSLPGP